MARTCTAAFSEAGREPETLTCGEDWGHDPPHIDPDDGMTWEVVISTAGAEEVA